MHEFLRETCALPIEAKLNGISCCRRRCLCLLCLNARFWWRRRSAEEERRKARRAVVAPLGKDFAWLAKRKRRCCFMRKVTNTANTPRSTETMTIYMEYILAHTSIGMRGCC